MNDRSNRAGKSRYALLAVAAITGALLSGPASAQSGACADNYVARHGAYEYTNNIWNRSNSTGTQCVTENGWTWDWPLGSGVRSYPSVVYGFKPWFGYTTTGDLPVRASSLTSLTATFEVTTTQTGANNTAFSMWFTSATPPAPSVVTTELMIWVDRNGALYPAGRLIGAVEIDGRTYDLYNGGMGDWQYVAFLAREQQLSGVLNLQAFISAAVGYGLLDPNEFLADIEFGNEIVFGTGTTTINTLSYSILTAIAGAR